MLASFLVIVSESVFTKLQKDNCEMIKMKTNNEMRVEVVRE